MHSEDWSKAITWGTLYCFQYLLTVSYKLRTAKLEKVKEESEERKASASSALSGEEPALSSDDEAGAGMVASEVDDDPLKEAEIDDENASLLASMGITRSMDDFFGDDNLCKCPNRPK